MSPTRAGQAPLPTFLIIGAERSATRWLRANLDRHPEVFAPPVTLDWFTDVEAMRARGRRWYQSQFDDWDGEPILGEASASYLRRTSLPDQVAARIHRSVPEVRLVAILRRPVDRLESAVRQHIKRGSLPADVDVFDLVVRHDPLVDELDLIGAGLYAACLYPYLQLFGEQLLVIDHDDVAVQPEKVYESVLRHIGAAADFAPPDLDRVRFSDRPTIQGPELTDEQRRILHMAFRLDLEELEALLGRDLSAWDPGSPPFERREEVDQVLAAIPPSGPLPEADDLAAEAAVIDDDDGDELDEDDSSGEPPVEDASPAAYS